MRILIAQQLWQFRPGFQCLYVDFLFTTKLAALSIKVTVFTPALRTEAPLLCRWTDTASALESLESKKIRYSNWDTAAVGEMHSTLEVAEHCGFQPAKHVNMSLNLSVWDVSGTTCILKLNTCFTRSGQMVLHAQKWHLQGHIGSVWQS